MRVLLAGQDADHADTTEDSCIMQATVDKGCFSNRARLGVRAGYSSGLGDRIHVNAPWSLGGLSAPHMRIFVQQPRILSSGLRLRLRLPKPSSHGNYPIDG